MYRHDLLAKHLQQYFAQAQPQIVKQEEIIEEEIFKCPFLTAEEIFQDVVPSVESNEFYSISYIGTQGYGKSTSAAELATLAQKSGYLLIYGKAEDILADLQGWIKKVKALIAEHGDTRVCFILDDMSYATGTISTKAAAKFKHFVGDIRHQFEEKDENDKVIFAPKIFMIYISHRYHSLPPMLRNSPTWLFVSALPEDKADAMKLIPRLKDEKDKLEALCSFLLKVTNDGPKLVDLEFTFGSNVMNFKWGKKEDAGDGRLMMSLHRGVLKIYNAKKKEDTVDLEHYRIKHEPAPEITEEEIKELKRIEQENFERKARELTENLNQNTEKESEERHIIPVQADLLKDPDKFIKLG